MNKIVFILIFIAAGQNVFAQKDSITYQDQYFSISSQNDFFQYWLQSDKHFTNGTHFTLAHRIFNNKTADWLLLGLKDYTYKEFSLAFGQDIHTPENWDLTTVDSTDRPYAGLLYFTYTKTSTNLWKSIKIITNFYLGIQGPAALGDEVQNFMHRLFGNNHPFRGWNNQIGNGLILDYDVKLQKMWPIAGKIYEVNILTTAHIGTVYNYFHGGFQFKLGKYNNSYYNKDGVYQTNPPIRIMPVDINNRQNVKGEDSTYNADMNKIISQINRKYQYYFFTEFHLGYMVYDGTARGSLIQFEPSPYVLNQDQIDPLIINLVYGFCFGYQRWMLRYYRIIQNNSFEKGDFSGWGEISIYYSF